MISLSTVKYIGYGLILISCISVGYGIADTIRIKPLKATVKQLEAEKSVLNEAYMSQRVATVALTEDLNALNKTCASRLSRKDVLIEDIRKICKLNSGGAYENPTNDVTLDMLNSLFP